MEILYTVSSGYKDPQSNFVNSLGGFVSSSQVPNDEFDAVFDELSVSEIVNKRKQYKAIVLHNNSDETLENVELWFESDPNNVCLYKIAAVNMNEDEEGQLSMESIPNSYSRPLNATFYEATVDDKVSIGDMNPDAYIGIWLAREVDYDKAKAEYDNVAERDLSSMNRYKPIEKKIEEKFDLMINWL